MVSARILSVIVIVCSIAVADAQRPTSEYTSTADKQCTMLEEQEEGGFF